MQPKVVSTSTIGQYFFLSSAVGHIGKSAVKETAGAVGAVGSAATGAVGAVGSVATGAVGEAASIAGAGIGKVGQFTRLVGSFDSNEGGGLLDMNDPTRDNVFSAWLCLMIFCCSEIRLGLVRSPQRDHHRGFGPEGR